MLLIVISGGSLREVEEMESVVSVKCKHSGSQIPSTCGNLSYQNIILTKNY